LGIGFDRWNVVRGDKVEVINGPEKGKQGTVLKVIRAQNRVIIEGVNIVSEQRYWFTYHHYCQKKGDQPLTIAPIVDNFSQRRRTEKPTMQGASGKIITYPAAINVANVNLVCPKTK